MSNIDKIGVLCSLYLGMKYGNRIHDVLLGRSTVLKSYYDSYVKGWMVSNPVFTESQLLSLFYGGTGWWCVYTFKTYIPIVPLVGVITLASITKEYFPPANGDENTGNNKTEQQTASPIIIKSTWLQKWFSNNKNVANGDKDYNKKQQ